MAVLLMVGRGQEDPSIVARLLDVPATPRKPQYTLAPDAPLLLHACGFSVLPAWRRSAKLQQSNEEAVAGAVDGGLVAAALAGAALRRLRGDAAAGRGAAGEAGGGGDGAAAGGELAQGGGAAAGGKLGQGGGGGGHIPLLKRACEPSMEERFVRAGLDLATINQPGGGGRDE
jgi:tRNA pseudouridine38/39 synthase